MTPEELDRWSAEVVMGWTIQDSKKLYYWEPVIRIEDWHPTADADQCFMVVSRMRELGYAFSMDWGHESIPGCSNLCRARFLRPQDKFRASDNKNFKLAILQAAHAALSKQEREKRDGR